MFETAPALRGLSKDRRERLGAVALVVGIALVGVVGFGPVPSTALQVLVGTLGVLVMVLGVLLVGTSEGTV